MIRNITIKNKLLLVANLAFLFAAGISVFTLFHKIDPAAEKYLELCIILFTICFQLLVISQIKRKYTSPKMQLYFIHPAFYINVAVIVFFFSPFLFYRFQSDFIFWWLLMDNNLKALTYFCLSIIILNILFLLLDKQSPRLSKKIEEFDNIIDTIKEKLPILFVLYGLAWFTRILTILLGEYSLIFSSADSALAIRTQYPLLYPAFMFFNFAIYFPVLFALCVLYFTAFKTNKNYKLFMICILLADILYFLPIGAKSLVLLPILAYGLAGLIFKQRVARQLIIVIIIVFFTLPIYNSYRTLGGTMVGTTEALEMAKAKSFDEEKGYLSLSFDSLFRRADAFTSYFYFTQKVEDNFTYGATYASILSGLLPDFLIPLPDYLKDKSLVEHVRDQGIIGPGERMWAGAPSPWGEFYLNFGYAGVVIGVPLLGLFCLFMFRLVLHGHHGYLLLIYLYIPFAFVFITQAGLAALISPLIKMAVVLFIVNVVMKLRFKKHISLQKKTFLNNMRGTY